MNKSSLIMAGLCIVINILFMLAAIVLQDGFIVFVSIFNLAYIIVSLGNLIKETK